MKVNKKFTKRIVAGKYKSTVIDLPSKSTTRSSKGIVLESFFNSIGYDIIDSIFVEVFAGSGSIGLEALSRGAKKVYFLEKDSDVIRVLKKNIAKTDPTKCRVLAGDSFQNIDEVLLALYKDKSKAYFYIDPPFSIRENMEDVYDKSIKLISTIAKEAVCVIAIEHMSGLTLPKYIGPFTCIKTKKFGKTTLTYME